MSEEIDFVGLQVVNNLQEAVVIGNIFTNDSVYYTTQSKFKHTAADLRRIADEMDKIFYNPSVY